MADFIPGGHGGRDCFHQRVPPKRQWPKIEHATKPAITFEEHQRIIEGEAAAARRNQGSRNSNEPHYHERLSFYKLCWHLGGSQSDIAFLTADDIDWTDRTIGYGAPMDTHGTRMKSEREKSPAEDAPG